MDVKFTLQGMGDEFFNGWIAFGEEIKGFDNMTPSEKYKTLERMSQEMKYACKRKEMPFREIVDLNSIMKRPHDVAHNVSPRKGYAVHTFSFTPA